MKCCSIVYSKQPHTQAIPCSRIIIGVPQGAVVPPSLKEALDNLKDDVAEVC